MITELAILHTRKDENRLFEDAFRKAQKIISKMNGYIEHELQKCIEEENKYILIVKWNCIEDHVEGFRKHKQYAEWKKLLHHFYDPFPVVEHYKKVN